MVDEEVEEDIEERIVDSEGTFNLRLSAFSGTK